MNIRYFSLLSILITVILLFLGTVLNSYQGQLMCPEWPLCYASELPNTGSRVYELLHRGLGTILGLMVIALAFLIHRTKDKYQEYRRLSRMAVFLVAIQGALGALSVLYRLPTVVTTSHQVMSLGFLMLLLSIDFGLSKFDTRVITKINEWTSLGRHSLGFSIFFFLFFVTINGISRHSGGMTQCSFNSPCFDLSKPEFQFFLLSVVFGLISFIFLLVYLAECLGKIKSTLVKSGSIVSVLSLIALLASFIWDVSTSRRETNIYWMFFTVLFICPIWPVYLALKDSELRQKGAIGHSFLSDLLGLFKPRLASLVMMTVVVGIVLAPRPVGILHSVSSLILVFMVVAGAAAMNCYIERDIDKQMERTKDRALPSGRFSPALAMGIAVGLEVFSITALALKVNLVTAILGFIAAFLYLYAYTPMKRYSPAAVYVGAIPGAIPPVMGWTTITGQIDLVAISLFTILFIWQIPHFFAISMYLDKDYEMGGIKVYSNVKGLVTTSRNIFIYTVILTFSSLLPWVIGWASVEYVWAALILGLVFTAFSMKFKSLVDDHARRVWARGYFIGSIIYLPLLFGALISLK